ncbi:hypothetical protein CDAR_105521 [Caerostris darwini]|uniref:Uncharacterized protein n=1 Tax=Caerostris darwini TaxID=1538125 RepID=A0AAV4N0Y5_9ARAC|nr:hypothetical protein CDAR_105521 [Caerostris darwini]
MLAAETHCSLKYRNPGILNAELDETLNDSKVFQPVGRQTRKYIIPFKRLCTKLPVQPKLPSEPERFLKQKNLSFPRPRPSISLPSKAN